MTKLRGAATPVVRDVRCITVYLFAFSCFVSYHDGLATLPVEDMRVVTRLEHTQR